MTAMTIGALGERSGFRPKTIRYYESIGLLPEPRRRPSGYREYDDDAERRLQFIARAKQLGLSLDDACAIALNGVEAAFCPPEQKARLRAEFTATIAELRAESDG